MSNKKVKSISANNNSFNIDIEELKGTRVTINGDESKYLVVYENDVSFVEGLISYGDYLNSIEKEYSELSKEVESVEDDSDEAVKEKMNKTLDKMNDIINNSKESFNKLFKDETAFDRIFNDVKSINLIVIVFERILNFVLNARKDNINSTSKYTSKYKK